MKQTDQEILLQQIHTAWKNVTLGNGTSLSVANSMDYLEGTENFKEDEKQDWTKITTEKLEINKWAITYFNSEGFKFHLPCYLADLKGELNEIDIIDVVCRLPTSHKEFYSIFNQQQRDTVGDFLNYKLQNAKTNEKNVIQNSLKLFWLK